MMKEFVYFHVRVEYQVMEARWEKSICVLIVLGEPEIAIPYVIEHFSNANVQRRRDPKMLANQSRNCITQNSKED